MSKIDCSVTVNYLRERERMCPIGIGTNCPNYELYSSHGCKLVRIIKDDPDRAVKIVQKWSDEHPVKTRLDDLLEKYPKLPLRDDGLLDFLPSRLGYCEDCRNCRCFENISSGVCWNEPLEGGATGKAVE